MAIFPHLELEDSVQVNDRTRLSGINSYVTQDNAAVDTIEIKPGSSGSYITVYDSAVDTTLTSDDWYLDWEFTQSCDITSANNKLDFAENNVELIATLTTGTYATVALLAAQVETQLNAAGTNTYTVSYASNKITISADASFELLPKGASRTTSILPVLGFTENTAVVTTVTGKYVEYLPVEVLLKVDDGTSNSVQSRHVNVFSVDGDLLFSSDADLKNHEPDILKYLEKGRNTFLNIHRRAQHLILAWLDRNGYVNLYNEKYTKRDVIDLEEVHEWAVFVTLRLIFEGLIVSVDDIFAKKAASYGELEKYWRDRAVLRIDVDSDGVLTQLDRVDIRSAFVVRR